MSLKIQNINVRALSAIGIALSLTLFLMVNLFHDITEDDSYKFAFVGTIATVYALGYSIIGVMSRFKKAIKVMFIIGIVYFSFILLMIIMVILEQDYELASIGILSVFYLPFISVVGLLKSADKQEVEILSDINESQTLANLNFPPLMLRIQSMLIDQVFLVVCMIVVFQIISQANLEVSGTIRAALLFGLFFVYEPVCIALGCTVGNYLVGIRVRRINDETKNINLLNSYFRFIVKITLGLFSFFTVTSSQMKRAIHDKASESIMIYA